MEEKQAFSLLKFLPPKKSPASTGLFDRVLSGLYNYFDAISTLLFINSVSPLPLSIFWASNPRSYA